MANVGCKVIVKGHVQGVGFRYYTSLEAGKQGVTGHVENLDDGNVEVTLYGSYENVSAMLQWLEKGPETARVDDLDVSDIPYIKASGFSYY
ncbi:MAG: acylphosphatase [Psychromonas sp.]